MSLAQQAHAKVSAAQKEKAAILSVAAHHALDKGDFKMAAKLYDSAFAADPEQPGYLYSAARARQRDGLTEQAEAQFRRCLELIGDPKHPVAKKALQRLTEIKAARADELARRLAAESKARAAAERRLQTEARARRKAAEDKAKKEAAESAERERRLGHKPPETSVTVKPQPGQVPESNVQSAAVMPRWAGWASVALGVAAVGAGGYIAWDNWSQWTTIRDKHMPLDDGTPPQDDLMTFEDAEAFAASTNNYIAAGIATAVVGGVAIGWGIATALTGSDRVTFIPQRRGATVVMRW